MGNQFSRKNIEWDVNENGCYVCTSHAKDKFGYIRIRIDGKLDRLHREIYRQCLGEIPIGNVVMHKCDNPSCINIEHLILGTQIENIKDCINKKRRWIPTGIKNGRAKLNEMQISNILSDNRRQIDIAKDYGVTQAHISLIKLNKTWKHDMYLKEGAKSDT